MTACDWIRGLWLSGGDWQFACRGEFLSALLATGLALLVCAFAVVWLLRKGMADIRATGGLTAGSWLATFVLVPLAAFLVAVAAGAPELAHVSGSSAEHIVVVVDQSESARRQPELRDAATQQLADYLDQLRSSPERQIRVSLVEFASGARTVLDRGSGSAASQLLRADTTPGALDIGRSEIGVALREAQRIAGRDGDADTIVLLSDGNDTGEGLARLADEMPQHVPVYVVAIDAGAPAEGIVSAYLPTAVESGADPKLRAVFDPGDTAVLSWSVAVRRNGEPIALEAESVDFDGTVQQLRLPVRFDGRGVQYADLALEADNETFARRLFTLVKGPVRVLALGDGNFLSALPTDRFEVVRANSSSPDDFLDYDVVVLDAVEASTLSADQQDALARGISTGGLGLLLVNGPMQGTPEDATVILGYAETPLDPLLPVSANPRFLVEEPPPRDIIVMVDTSGSMGDGFKLGAAKEAIRGLMRQIRPVDRMRVITFAEVDSQWQWGTPAGVATLESFVSNMAIMGASDASPAFAAASREAGNYTAVFLITDGDLVPYNYRKDGMSFYYVEVGFGSSPANADIAASARDSQMLSPSGGSLQIAREFFEPEERTEFFSPDTFDPLMVEPMDGVPAGLSTPGVALSFARVDARRVLLSTTNTGDPLLAFRAADGLGGGRTAVFMSQFGPSWTDTKPGRVAISRIVEELSAWSKRERYDLRFADLGGALLVRATVIETADQKGLPDGILVKLVGEGASGGSKLAAVPGEPGVYVGRLDLPSGEGRWRGLLHLVEEGAGAQSSVQAIPVTLPAAAPAAAGGREAITAGINIFGLRALAEATGGAIDRLPDIGEFVVSNVPPQPLHLFFIAFAALTFGLGMLGREVKL